jgi:hypothetical protein
MADTKKLTEEELDSVAGGIGDVDMSGANVQGDVTMVDYSINIGNKLNIGDKISGNKKNVDVDATVDTNIDL